MTSRQVIRRQVQGLKFKVAACIIAVSLFFSSASHARTDAETLAEVEKDLPPIRVPEPIVLDAGKAIKQLLAAEDGPEGDLIRQALKILS